MNIPLFRINFPEFTNETVYPNSMLEFWAGVAEQMLPLCVWKTMWTQGVNLYVAHEVVLASQNIKAAQVGGPPGQQGGIANTKTVGSVTVGYDSQSNSEQGAGYWNLTNYGKQLYRFIKIFGAGARQL